MIFKGEPNQLVRVDEPNPGEPPYIRFDKKGFYETENPQLILRMTGKFPLKRQRAAGQPEE